MKSRLFMISVFILLIIGPIFIFGSAITNTNIQYHKKNGYDQQIMIDQEKGVFQRAGQADRYNEMPNGNRTMANYYNNRAFPGAPPMIVHPLVSEKGIGGKTCLQCHQNGGYVQQFDAFAPVTPHPEWLNCKQCHLPMNTTDLFRNSSWEKPKPPKLGIQALITSPIVMPHGLQNREDCLSCHAGPSAPKEIKVTHPERINCRQCHVPLRTDEQFVTPVESRPGSTFQRSGIETGFIPLDTSKVQEISTWVRKYDKEKEG